jgi:hypothetical protein
MLSKFIDALDADIVSSPRTIQILTALLTPGSALIPIPQVGDYGSYTHGYRVKLSGQNTWPRFYTPAQHVRTASNNVQ